MAYLALQLMCHFLWPQLPPQSLPCSSVHPLEIMQQISHKSRTNKVEFLSIMAFTQNTKLDRKLHTRN